ncbi:hypothetical protein CLAFUW4_11531 [Fulvia fulva]|uniref:Uncharacterized protein n=1 Tax=Passalora fulva TaxID=5499 RepID=A0A9Q8PD79_PASFU|nr:uncharacterized protein CLAFUR5_10574 [Fulvia fulva]KAK4620035.1 hypothetical protein CLAFUR4_11537 [Fulvia fulva]KAK4620502.1 hypothetical protein CLAFUR0_11545 [Fulvia fulva]UJO20257.1 hypothetical protein CLAFUR5_10574 [Fulvia fulva]WPV17424.1 hypothetical protein CLAFUW4_11531 [Fulvia fulva]WPV32140.1 hypothetical protein CLAFUW7_11536 [Fulvia fulva]
MQARINVDNDEHLDSDSGLDSDIDDLLLNNNAINEDNEKHNQEEEEFGEFVDLPLRKGEKGEDEEFGEYVESPLVTKGERIEGIDEPDTPSGREVQEIADPGYLSRGTPADTLDELRDDSDPFGIEALERQGVTHTSGYLLPK